MLVIAGVLWLTAAAPVQAHEGGPSRGAVVEPAEAEVVGAVTPSGAAGLSLLAAAVVGTIWNVAVGERRRAQRAG